MAKKILRQLIIPAAVLLLAGVESAVAEPNWAALVGTNYFTHQDDGCIATGKYAGKHKYASRLWNIPSGESWEQACAETPMTLAGRTYESPHECVNTGITGIWGEWYIADSQCEDFPLPYARGVDDELRREGPLSGYVDLHTHLMSHLGFGGVIFHGEPYGDPETALDYCPSHDGESHSGGHSRVEAILQDDILGAAFNTARHDNEGYPNFPYWPAYNGYTHQTMYYEWVRRAYQGGLRAMVVLAVNGDYMFGATDNGLPDIIKGIPIASDPVLDLNDMATLRRQTEAVFDMQSWIDARNGGVGKGWFRIVTSPEQAREVIAAGKLAVILGSEVDYLLDCREDNCDTSDMEAGIDELYDMGLRYIFPVHLKTNGYGGAALYNILASGDRYDCPHYGQDCNVQGLTEAGQMLMKTLMRKGMLIDLGHMSARTMADALDVAEQEAYPGIVTGHTGLYDMANGDNRHEGNPSGRELQRIVNLGGMVGLIPGQGNLNQVGEWRNEDGSYIAHACGASSQTFAQSYQYLLHLLGDAVYDGRITVGTDFNGFAHMPGPRFGADACPGGHTGIAQPDSTRVHYPFATDPALIPAAEANTNGVFGKYQFANRTYDYNTDGAAHIGLMPDFLEDLRQQGLKRSDLEPLYRSADYLTVMWQNAVDHSVLISP
ncbi:membrane dipeptidase [Gynuella sp.]|uniref:membrane dipeptidase n=1 Tax=Gynuella sp. TaxID=2969146 RepID=UPI003D0DD45A